jgi:S-formylglutathione hydrolase FrmB
MALREVEGPAGAPWHRRLAGALDELTVESELLRGNPLEDPTVRPLYVYRSPGVLAGTASGVPSVYMLQGYAGQVDQWLGRDAFQPTLVERLDAMYAAEACPDAVIVFVDAWTSLGGSQFLNSASTGPYMDYLCDEIVPFVDEHYLTRSDRDHRGVAGKSSGGYGAMVVPMVRPDVFGALASHAGDALFECCYLPEFPAVIRALRDHFAGSFENLLEAVQETDHFEWDRFGPALSLYAYAAAYTPDPDQPGRALLPVDTHTGRLDEEIWEQWLAHDPVRMAPRHAEALRSMRRIYLDAGRRDEWFLDLGARAFSAELDKLGVAHTLELFDGRHGGISYRYPGAIRELVLALGD